ncbi:hypothetical protein ACIO1C_29795 [Streptomyces sp. NPDC087420]|uniref:hypothetical protein n=1 Tax=Streptomyces sp. NPDC087420 TaxID=3365785 RepID=UPI003835C77A
MLRYKISFDITRSWWVIYDRTLFAECAITEEDGTVRPLRWAVPNGDVHAPEGERALKQATAWLKHCYRTWGAVPTVEARHPANIV